MDADASGGWKQRRIQQRKEEQGQKKYGCNFTADHGCLFGHSDVPPEKVKLCGS
jgi:hypothetical protein